MTKYKIMACCQTEMEAPTAFEARAKFSQRWRNHSKLLQGIEVQIISIKKAV